MSVGAHSEVVVRSIIIKEILGYRGTEIDTHTGWLFTGWFIYCDWRVTKTYTNKLERRE